MNIHMTPHTAVRTCILFRQTKSLTYFFLGGCGLDRRIIKRTSFSHLSLQSMGATITLKCIWTTQAGVDLKFYSINKTMWPGPLGKRVIYSTWVETIYIMERFIFYLFYLFCFANSGTECNYNRTCLLRLVNNRKGTEGLSESGLNFWTCGQNRELKMGIFLSSGYLRVVLVGRQVSSNKQGSYWAG